MFANVRVTEPLERVAEDWDFLAERVLPRFSTFKPLGQNIYGIRRRAITAGGVTDLKKGSYSGSVEMSPSGIVTWEPMPFHLHITSAGTPHRVQHSFGYWHINDVDEMYLPMPGEGPDDLGYFILLMAMPVEGQGDRFAWYCERCLTMMHEEIYPTGDAGFNGFWRAERAAVDAYNADPARRRCPECDHVNPLGYCWNTNKDSEAERQARALW